MRRIIGSAHLTYEQLYTILVQVEAILNSRPLTSLTDYPDDLDPLTPSHFLIGRKLTSLPQRYLEDTPPNRLKIYARIQQLLQQFWRRWHKDYLAELQSRTKWKASSSSLDPGQMVFVKEDNIPPLNWSLGRVTAVHSGPDGTARVATVKTANGQVKRPVVKLCPLPGLCSVLKSDSRLFKGAGMFRSESSK